MGLFGGSFNPPHLGHVAVAQAVRDALGLDALWLMPAGKPPHKPDHPEMASAEDRLEMTRLAAGEAGLEVTDVELRRTGPSYTIDTVRALEAAHPEAEFHFLIGADSVDELPTWHRAAELLAEVPFVVVARPGHSIEEGLAVVARELGPEAAASLRARVVRAPELPISSTAIRQKIKDGDPTWRNDVPPGVARFIEERGLYRRSA